MGENNRVWDEEGKEKERGGEWREGRRTPFLSPHLFPSGPTCSEEMTACHSGPCLNGGSCNPSPGGYYCTCPPSHTGPQCQTITDYCVSGECPLCHGAGGHRRMEELGRVCLCHIF